MLLTLDVVDQVTEITSPESVRPKGSKIQVGNIRLDALTEREVVDVVCAAWTAGQGGSIVTVNADIARAARRHPHLAKLIGTGSLIVADGMPLIWATRIAGCTLPERVAGSSLIFSLSEAAAANGMSVFIFGGADGVPAKAAHELCARFPNLRIAGTESPPLGFDQTEDGVRNAVATVTSAAPDLVFVGLGFPRQEQLIQHLRPLLPNAWYLGCGGGIPMAAGVVRRAPPLMQRLGLEWAHRLVMEPRRLAGRYLRDDLPFAIGLLGRSVVHKFTRRNYQTTE
jgi:N-acetylglucosaminyldiphosphoundecaprenol N-acetyl-beta-D-mannosaminyltransferase